jgi:glycosyltransferase involved in cell wall biosynthesis
MTVNNTADDRASRPLVTVGMPVYNEERFVGQAIESVLAQTYVNVDLLISDDASTDRTAAICREFAARDTRIRFVQQTVNLGPFLNLKYVTDNAAGELLVWLAQDDAIANRYIEHCVRQIQANDRSVLVSSDFRIIDESGNPIRVEALDSIRASIPWEKRRAEFFKFPVYSNVFYCFYGLMRTNAGKAMFDHLQQPRYMSQIELPVLARLAAAGEISSFCEVLRDYRRVATSLYHTERRSLLRKPRLLQMAIQGRHFGRLIGDQVSILLHSSLSAKAKTAIVLRLIHYYCLKCPIILIKGRPA